MMSTLQRTFDFDKATLSRCVRNLRPKSLQTLFKGLLFAAAEQPEIVEDIQTETGRIVLNASVELIATWAIADERTIRRNKILHADLVTHVADINRPGLWEFNLSSVLPQSAIGWFVELVSDSQDLNKTCPDKMQNVTLTKSKCHPDKSENVRVNVTLTKPSFSSMCLVLNTARLAGLAGCCEKSGIAVSCSGDSWEDLSVDPEGLQTPEVIESLYQLATTSGTIAETPTTRNRWFTLAAIACRKDTPWNWFRRAVVNGWLETTQPTSVDASRGKALRRQADEIQRRQAELQDAAVRAAQPVAAADPVSAVNVPAESAIVPVTPEAARSHLEKTAFGQALLRRREQIEAERVRRTRERSGG
jgi:hypothetical protein